MRFLPAFVLLASCHIAPAYYPRDTQAQHNTAVGILTLCMDGDEVVDGARGSGVAMGGDRVLTAYHVVDCEGNGTPAVSVFYGDMLYPATIEVVEKSSDLARLRLNDSDAVLSKDRPVLGDKPQIGDTVCLAPVVPSRTHKCGEVQPYRNAPLGDLRHTALSEPGNSGAGMYDSKGELVGIVTHLILCENGQWCGGLATSLDSHRWVEVF